MNLLVDDRQNLNIIRQELQKLLERAVALSLQEEGWDEEYEVSLSLVNNEEIQNLNKIYRGKNQITDVLSFPLVEDKNAYMEEKLLGDIVISVQKAKEQADEYNHSFEREMTFLVVHSMFHLMGYDHDTHENERIMRKKQETILAKLQLLRN